MNGYHSGMNDRPIATRGTETLDWGLVQQFLDVAEAGSLGRAALALGLSQPTLSRRIAELEAVLGQALFERTSRGLTLTQAGQALRQPALAMREQAQRLCRAADHHARTVVGTVRITASEAVSAYVLLPCLRTLRQIHPGIQIEVVPSDVEEDLLARRADIAVRMYRPTQSSLVVRRLADMPLGLYAHRDYLARRGRPTRSNMDEHEWIGLDRADAMLRGFAAAGHPVTREFFGLRCDSSVLTWQAVVTGCGVGVGLRAVGDSAPGVVRVLEDVHIAPMPAWLAVHRELRGSARLRVVFDALAHALSTR